MTQIVADAGYALIQQAVARWGHNVPRTSLPTIHGYVQDGYEQNRAANFCHSEDSATRRRVPRLPRTGKVPLFYLCVKPRATTQPFGVQAVAEYQ
jgi:hypothetical protein